MAKIRVHELAKELGMSSKEMVNTLHELGLEVKNHMSTMEESQVNWVKKKLNPAERKNNVQAENKQQKTKDVLDRKAKQPHPKDNKGNNFRTSQPSSAQDFSKRPEVNGSNQSSDKSPVKETASHNNRSNQERREFSRNNSRPNNSNKGQIREKAGNKKETKGERQEFNRNNLRNEGSNKVVNKEKHDNSQLPKNERKEFTKNDKNKSNKSRIDGENVETREVKTKKQDRPNQFKKNPAEDKKRDYSRPQKKPKHKKRKEENTPQTPEIIRIEESITVRELAEKLCKSPADVVKKLMELGTMAAINQVIDFDTAEIVANLFEVKVEKEIPEEEKLLEEIIDDEASLKLRPPVVTVMGHVDHGKTSLLDRIRKADVVSGEAGGITQHIGAYQVSVNGNKITFIDTPGHEAFTAMRARGANLTDLVILVVAADDGVMPQTVEAINHIKAADVPFVVAVNKIDKPEANPDRVMQQLTEYNIVSEDWGGDTIFVPVSAKTGEGIDNLLEMLLLVAEMQEITANPDRPAEGVVIEGELDKGRGAVATVLVQKGTLNVGDCVVCGSNMCKVRAMIDDRGRRVDKALPSMPVEIMGWSDVPEAGEKVIACDEKIAKEVVSLRVSEKKLEEQKQSSRVSLDDFFKQMQDSEVKELNVIIKGDVQGSIEALSQSLQRLSTDEVKVNVIHSAVGAVSETDVMLASASNAIIIGFNVRPESKARKHAEEEDIDVRLYRVIYEAIDDVKKAMAGLLEPEYREKYIGRAEVRATFKVPNIGTIAGSYVIDGKMQRNANIRVLRDGVIVYEGTLSSLKRFKDDAKEVVENYECGIGIKDFNDVKEGDVIEAFVIEEIPREL